MRVQEGYDVELIAALLNSAVTFLMLELHGTARHLGVLDLNANDLKQFKCFNPDILSESQKKEILSAFEPLKSRKILTIYEEVEMEDRINFDKTILRCYGLDETILDNIYVQLTNLVNARISMKNR